MRKIEVFVRHCHFSSVSQHKNRLPGYSREKCHENLLSTVDDRVNVTFFLDTFHPMEKPHFVLEQSKYPVVQIRGGTETSSFLQLLDYVAAQNFTPDTIVYFLEDDYLHKTGWVDILLEGFTIPQASYVTLFDHRDKYFFPEYEGLTSQLFHTTSCHWRTTPSTTNSYAMRFATLLKDLEIHRAYSEGRKITADHEKFLKLAKKGGLLISPIPGWSTHVEKQYLSPCTDWESMLNSHL
ncbi:MAG: hypothetical protein JSR58_04735 [Verrucomicrobia bacterium]|nr:hypothetical protein [Verrucomicrobiota bacterium]